MEGVDPYAGTGVGSDPKDIDCDTCTEEKNQTWGTCYNCPLSPASAVQSYEAVRGKACTAELYQFVERLFSLAGQINSEGKTRIPPSRMEIRGLRVLRNEQQRFEATAAERFEQKRKRERAMRGPARR